MSVGDADSLAVGSSDVVGISEGADVGGKEVVGADEGSPDGLLEDEEVGTPDTLGAALGKDECSSLGVSLGADVGSSLGVSLATLGDPSSTFNSGLGLVSYLSLLSFSSLSLISSSLPNVASGESSFSFTDQRNDFVAS